MEMLYNSDNFVVVRFDVEAGNAASATDVGSPYRGGYEIVDKFAGKEIFIQGAMAETFKQGVDALIEEGPSEEALDDFIGRYASLMQQPVVLH